MKSFLASRKVPFYTASIALLSAVALSVFETAYLVNLKPWLLDSTSLSLIFTHSIAVAGNAFFFVQTLKYFRQSTTTNILPSLAVIAVGWAPIAAFILLLFGITSLQFSNEYKTLFSSSFDALFVFLVIGWYGSAVLWPFAWGKLIKEIRKYKNVQPPT